MIRLRDNPSAHHERRRNRMSHSQRLKSKIRLADPRLQEQLALFWDHANFTAVFAEHLAKLYFAVNASIPLLECALEQSNTLSKACPVAAGLIPYLTEHIEEEQYHDEWLLDDIETLGIDRTSVTARMTPPDVAAMIGTQYYYIKHVHPVSMLAYLAVIEGSPPRREELDRVAATQAVPKASLRSFYKHAEFDIGHSEELWSLIDRLPLEPWHETLLGLNVMVVTDQLATSMEDVLASAEKP